MAATCSKCGSERIVPPQAAFLRVLGGEQPLTLQAFVYEHPDAMLRRGGHPSAIAVTICGDCGHIDLTATACAELYAAFQVSTGAR